MQSGNLAYNSGAFHRALAKLARLKPGHAALDLGCGRGRTLGPILELIAPGGSATGLDISADQLALTKRTHAGATSSGQLSLVQHDAARPLPFEEGRFDAIVCQNVLECIPDKTSFLAQCHRVLRPGGVLVLGHHDFDGVLLASSDRQLTETLVHAFAKVQLPGMAAADAQMGRQLLALMRGTPFRELETLSTLDVDLDLTGDGSIIDLLQSFRDAAPPGTDPQQLRHWREDLDRRASAGTFYCAVPWVCVIGVK
ncbi:MAG TPA: methyltransferase domain-containing protein [Dongiaceae bacterium]|jgi:ubiquinone/menaquinone biosynthesis C-methylase UbiE